MDTTKIIKGVVGSGRYTVTAPIVKEDYGLYLQIEGVELPSTYQVDFSNSENNGSSVTMIGNSDGVLIPNQFIKSGKDVFAFLYHVGADYGRTVYKFRIPNKVRPDRTDIQPTPAEQSTIDQLISALNGAVEQAEDAQEAIENMSVSATTLAEGSSATVTKSEQDGVVHLEFGIPKGATGDDGYSPTADVSKTGKTATITITDKNGTTTAQVEDGEDGTDGIDGISPSVSVTDITGGHRVVITDKDGAKSFDVADGATGATPNLTIGTVETLEPTESATATITGTAENPVLNFGIPQGDAGEVTTEEFLKAFPTDTASGAIASFTDGADNLPLKSLIVDINPIQDLSQGDPSPENICPISGRTSVDVEQRGVNFFGGEIVNMAYVVITDGVFVRVNASYRGIYAKVKGGHTYTVSRKTIESSRFRICATVEEPANEVPAIDISSAVTNDSKYALTFTVPSGYNYVLVYLSNSAEECTPSNYQIELGSTATPYEPYTGRSITINLGQTVYGAKLYPLEGKALIDMAIVDLGTLDWAYNAPSGERIYPYVGCAIMGAKPNSASTVAYPYAICSKYQFVPSSSIAKNGFDKAIACGGVTFFIADSAYNDLASFKASLSGVMLVYELATPLEIQLDAHTINSLYGVNNIWADSGDTEVVYRADTKLFIERLTAPDSADMIADANITSGKYFMVGNSLYKATANIANGSAIIVGTNAVRKSLSEALNEINA